MEVNSVKPFPSHQSYTAQTEQAGSSLGASGETVTDIATQQGSATGKQKQLNKEDFDKITKDMNKFLEDLNVNIQFKLHEKTQTLMVQVVDVQTQDVIKEFPPHEMLDIMAKIRDYIGALLDKKV